MIDELAQLVTLRGHIAELQPIAEAPYAVRTLERAKRRARDIEDRLVSAGVIVGLAGVA